MGNIDIGNLIRHFLYRLVVCCFYNAEALSHDESKQSFNLFERFYPCTIMTLLLLTRCNVDRSSILN